MSIFVIGDVQGCYDELIQLLDLIHFDIAKDELWFVGDLVNRGPKSLEVLRFVKKLPNCKVVLGNHDLHFLAVRYGAYKLHHGDTLQAVLNAPDCEELCHWLRQQKLAHYDAHQNYLMVHAGVPPQWNLQKVLDCAHELEQKLQDDLHVQDVLKNLYGDQPEEWNEQLTGFDRLRVICNYFTRMRFCDVNGKLDLKTKGEIGTQPPEFLPWFQVPRIKDKTENLKIIFGHWAALDGKTHSPNFICVDTGCVWGRKLSAFNLEEQKMFFVKSAYVYEK